MSKLSLQRFLAVVAAIVVFFGVACAIALSAPYLLGLLYSCFPPGGNCGDTVGWAMALSAPISVPSILFVAGLSATMVDFRVMHSKMF
jgi:hypothetical protein